MRHSLTLAILSTLFFSQLSSALTPGTGNIDVFLVGCAAELERRWTLNYGDQKCTMYLTGFIDGAGAPNLCGKSTIGALLEDYIRFCKSIDPETHFSEATRLYVESVCNAN